MEERRRQSGIAFAVGMIVLLLLGTVLRFVLLGKIPYGLNQDEASIGYDAWTLLHYGIDRNGYRYPVYPITWGSGGGSPLMIYLAVLSTALFGRSIASLRFFPALLGAFTIALFEYLPFIGGHAGDRAEKNGSLADPDGDGVRRGKAILGCCLGLLLAVNPWHFILSRWALDANTLPFFELAAICLFVSAAVRDSGRGRRVRYLLSAAVFAITPYAYGSATVVIPIALIVLAVCAIRMGRMNGRELGEAVLVYLVVFFPLGLFFLINKLGLSPIRTPWFSVPVFTSSRSVFSTAATLPSMIKNSMRYLMAFLTIGSEDGEIACNYIPGFAQCYRFTAPLTIGGAALCFRGAFSSRGREGMSIRCRITDVCFLVLTGATILFTLFIEPDINRVTLLLLPILYFQGRALAALLGLFWGRKGEQTRMSLRFLQSAGIAFVVGVALAAGLFFHDYFGSRYASLTRESFMPGYPEAVEEAVRLAGDDRQILSTYTHLSAPFIIALYVAETPPDVFLSTVRWKDPGAEFRVADRFAGFSFGLEDTGLIDLEKTVLILHVSEAEHFAAAGLSRTETFGDYVVVSIPR